MADACGAAQQSPTDAEKPELFLTTFFTTFFAGFFSALAFF
jgi:hypothetical protein